MVGEKRLVRYSLILNDYYAKILFFSLFLHLQPGEEHLLAGNNGQRIFKVLEERFVTPDQRVV